MANRKSFTRIRRFKQIVLIGGLMALPASEVLAQSFPVPSSALGTRIPEQFQQPAESATVTRAPLTIEREETEAPKGAEATKLTLTNVIIDGATVYNQQALAPLYQGEIGHQITLADVYKIADDLTVKYRNDGYILAKAIIPPQRIDGGTVHIRVVEGYVIKVDYDGDTKGNQAILDSYALAIQNDRPLRSETLERYLLLINDLPGVNAGSILQPSPLEPGAANLTIILNQKAYEAYATIDNRGSKYIGPFQDAIAGRFNSVFDDFDQTRVQVASVPGKERELQFLDAEESLPLNLEGTTLSFSGTYAHSRPGFILKPEDLESEDETADVAISHPVIRSREENLNMILDFGFRDSRSDIKVADSNVYIDHTRVLRLTANYQKSDELFDRAGSNQVSFEGHEGLGVLGASDYVGFQGADDGRTLTSRLQGHSDFTKFTSELSRTQEIAGKFSAQAALIGQYSFDPLLSSEQFGLGGAQYDRAYDPSEFLGDSGYGAKAELRYSDTISTGPVHSYQLYTYYDVGQVWNRHPQLGDPVNGLTAQSAGVGVRVAVTDYVSGYLEVAQPIARDVTTNDNKGSRAFFSIQGHY